jgi:hypothetical protein
VGPARAAVDAPAGVEVVPVRSVREVIQLVRGPGERRS